MFEEKRNSCGNVVLTASDTDGDEFSVEFYGSDMIEIMAMSDTGCIVLEDHEALELARMIIERLDRS